MKYKGIIFDLDGVLVNTDKYHYLAWKQIADRLGIYFDEEINNRLRGVSRMASLDIILEGGTKNIPQRRKKNSPKKRMKFTGNILAGSRRKTSAKAYCPYWINLKIWDLNLP